MNSDFGNIMSDDSSHQGGKRVKKLACIECRQQKSKCDAHERMPCSRCEKKQIQCTLQKDFRRTYKRQRNEEIEKKFIELTSKLGEIGAEPEVVNRIEYDDLRKYVRAKPAAGSAVNNLPVVDVSLLPLECLPKSLSDIHLSSEEIAEYYTEFVENYHPWLPIVNINRGPERIYRLSPALFWVIMLIGVRRRAVDIKMRLAALVKSVLAEITISPIIKYTPSENDEPLLNVASVFSVQAFLLYTFWPPSTSSLSADTSWNTIGVAMFQALRIGINTQDTHEDNKRTWMFCNAVSQKIASSFGFPAFVAYDTVHTEPVQEIALFENTVERTLHSAKDEKLALLAILELQLSDLENKLQVDDIRKVFLLNARVQLMAHYFGLDPSFEVKKGLVKSFNAACAYIEHCWSIQHVIQYFPVVCVLNLWQAACIVAKLVHSPLAQVLDLKLAKLVYSHAMQLTLHASVIKHDMAYRSSGIMKVIWSMLKREKEPLGHLTVRSRMAVNVFFDCLYILQKKCKEYDEDGKLRTEEAAEQEGRDIIKTVPLDPEPIVVGGSNSTSPNSDVFSLKTILNKNSPRGATRAGSAPYMPSIPSQLANASPMSAPGEIIPHRNRSSSDGSPLDWEQWDLSEAGADMVWRDVDMLMSEFAFNPTAPL